MPQVAPDRYKAANGVTKITNGIAQNLIEFGADEGNVGALAKAEKFRDALEEIGEIANPSQQQHVNELLAWVRVAIMRLIQRDVKDTYFKDAGDGRSFMSGLRLPRDSDGVVRNIRFIDCTFHPSCKSASFENCEFQDCTW